MKKESLPNVHFGPPNKKLDWRNAKDANDEDDDEVRKPPGSVMKILGVNPFKLFKPREDKKPFG